MAFRLMVPLTLLLLAVPSFAQMKCADLFTSIASTEAIVDDLVLFFLKEVEGGSEGPQKLIAQKVMREKFAELQARLGPEARAVYTSRLEALRKDQEAHRSTEETRKESRIRTETNDIVRWTQMNWHTLVDRVGPFIDPSRMFTVINDTLVIYDYKKKDITWTAKNVRGLEIPRGAQMMWDGRAQNLVIVHTKGIGVFNLVRNTYKHEAIEDLTNHTSQTVTLSASGEHILVRQGGGSALILKVSDLKPLVPPIGSKSMIVRVQESSDSRYALFTVVNGEHILVDTQTKKQIPVPNVQEPVGGHYHPTFTSDSRFLLLNTADGRLHKFDPITQTLTDAQIPMKSLREVHKSGDGRYMVFGTPYPNRGGNDPILAVYDTHSQTEVKLDFSRVDFETLMDPRNFGDYLYFLGRKDGPNRTTINNHYLLNFKTLEFESVNVDPRLLMNSRVYLAPDGRSLLLENHSSPLLEVR